MKRKLKFAIGLTYFLTVAINYSTHIRNSFQDSRESEKYFYPSIERLELREHKSKCLEEATNPWTLIPGSFLWRKVERPVSKTLHIPIQEIENFPLFKA